MAKHKLNSGFFFFFPKDCKLENVTQILSGEGLEMLCNTMPLSFPPIVLWVLFLPATLSGHKHTDKHATAVHQDLKKHTDFQMFFFKKYISNLRPP